MALDFSLSEEEEQIRQTARRMVARFVGRRDEYRRIIFDEQRLPEEMWQAFAESGFLGALVPEEHGGTALGLLALVFALEELGAQGFGSALLILTAMDTACIVKNGSAELKSRVLPEIAAGRLKLCFGLTEPNAGSNTFRIETVARRDGDAYLVTGQKVFITGADQADLMLLVARTTTVAEARQRDLPKGHGLTLFLVDPKAPGVTLRQLPTHGIEGSKQFHIFLEDVRIPAADCVGTPDAGATALFNSLNPERILAAAVAVGSTEYLLGRAVTYANERRVFRDQPIGAYQSIAHPLAELRIDLELCRLAARRAAWAFDQALPPAEVGFYANAAKYRAAEMFIAAADRAIQTLGGYGFSDEYGIIHYWTHARLLRTAPISKEMILNFVSEHTLGLPRSY
jgi:acyl-CoA dehydrogenase